MKYLTLIFISLVILFYSCQKIDNDDIFTPSPKPFDTITLVLQEFRAESLISNYDTHLVYIENNAEFSKISGEWDTINILKSTIPPTIEIFSKLEDRKCSNLVLELELDKLGQLYKSQCWTERNGIHWSDSGVGKIISTKFGVIFYRGYFTNSGHVISSINEDIISEKIKKKLMEMK